MWLQVNTDDAMRSTTIGWVCDHIDMNNIYEGDAGSGHARE
jgi:hypothetical protein